MSEAAEAQLHPLHELLEAIRVRSQRLAEAKGYTAEHVKHELRDELYPMLAELAAFVGELDDRMLGIESDEESGIDPELAEDIIEGLTRFGAALDILGRHVPAGTDDYRSLQEHLEWYKGHAAEIVEDVRAEPGEVEEPEPAGATS